MFFLMWPAAASQRLLGMLPGCAHAIANAAATCYHAATQFLIDLPDRCTGTNRWRFTSCEQRERANVDPRTCTQQRARNLSLYIHW